MEAVIRACDVLRKVQIAYQINTEWEHRYCVLGAAITMPLETLNPKLISQEDTDSFLCKLTDNLEPRHARNQDAKAAIESRAIEVAEQHVKLSYLDGHAMMSRTNVV
jgi:hypothetical protein